MPATAADADDAFRALVEPHRRALHAHCYRMLGSVQDAEDALQETLLRAWRSLAGLDRDRAPRAWLFKIATNVCLDAIGRRAHPRVISDGRPPAGPADGPGTPLVETVWLEPYPDEVYEQREGVELAFAAALQLLPARQRAVLLLREVLGFSAREVAEALETTTASVNSALQRARRTVDERLPSRSEQPLGDARERELVQAYVEAWERNDVAAIRALLVRDAIFAMPPYPNWWHGRDAVADMFARVGPIDLRHVVTRANGQPAVAWYVRARDRDAYAPSALEVLTLEAAGIAQITAFVTPALFDVFGLPAER